MVIIISNTSILLFVFHENFKITPDGILEFFGTILGIIGAYYLATYQIKRDKENSIDVEIYLVEYNAMNKIVENVLEIEKRISYLSAFTSNFRHEDFIVLGYLRDEFNNNYINLKEINEVKNITKQIRDLYYIYDLNAYIKGEYDKELIREYTFEIEIATNQIYKKIILIKNIVMKNDLNDRRVLLIKSIIDTIEQEYETANKYNFRIANLINKIKKEKRVSR